MNPCLEIKDEIAVAQMRKTVLSVADMADDYADNRAQPDSPQDTPMIDRTLKLILDQGLATIGEISELAGVAPSTVYRWIAGTSEPSFSAIAMLLRQVRNPQAQAHLVHAYLAGSSWQGHDTTGELDVNADGHIDVLDALDLSIDCVNTASQTLTDVRNLSRDGKVTENDAGHLMEMLRQLVHQCTITQKVLVRLSAPKKRKRARRVGE